MKKVIKAIIKPIIIIAIIALIVGLAYRYMQKRNKNYELEIVNSYSYYPLLQDSKYGIIDLQGNILVNPEYKQVIIPNPSKDVFVCVNENEREDTDEDDTTVVFNQQGEQIFKEYENVSAIRFSGTVSDMPYEKTVLSYKKDGKYGLIDYKGKKVTEPIYEEISSVPYKEGEILAKKDGKYGVINNKGVVLIEFEYDEITGDGFYKEDTKYKEAGYFVGKKTDDGYRYGYINNKFDKLIDMEYNEIYRAGVEDDEKNVYLIATKNGQVGVIYNKEEIIKFEYEDIEYDDESKRFLVVKDSKKGVFDINGTNIVPVNYDYVTYKGDYIYAATDNEAKYFDEFGKEIVEMEYLEIYPTDNVIYNITFSEDGKYGIIDGKGNVLVDNTYSFIDYAFDNYFIALRDGKLGVIDDKENNIIEFKYDVLQCINGTNVIQGKISDTDTMDLYSKQMEKVATVENAVINLYNDYIEVYSEKSTKYFDFEGHEKTNTQILKNNELFAIEKDGKWGMTDKLGNIVVDCIYDKVTELNEYGFAGIKLDGKWGVVDKTGNIILEPTYEHFANNEKPEFINKYYKVTYGYGESYYTNEE